MDDIQVATGDIPVLEDENRQSNWAELFHEEKTNWMGWERHLIEEQTDLGIEDPEMTEMG